MNLRALTGRGLDGRVFFGFFCLAILTGSPDMFGTVDAIWQAPPAAYEQRFTAPAAEPGPEGLLRWVWVEERASVARHGSPVRVPVFLAAGECRDADELVLLEWPSGRPVAFQADDVRAGPDGGLARLHLWFSIDLVSGEARRFALVRRAPSSMPPGAPVDIRPVNNRLVIERSSTRVEFFVNPPAGGPVASIALAGGPALVFPAGASGGATISVGDGPSGPADPGGGQLAWAAGPIFTKVTFRTHLGPSAQLEQDYRLFSGGSLDLIQIIAADDPGGMVVADQEFLRGTLDSGQVPRIERCPAGIVPVLADLHPGYGLDSIVDPAQPNAWLVVPGTLGGSAGRVELNAQREFRLKAPGPLDPEVPGAKAPGLRAFWSEVTLVPVARPAGRSVRAVAQPLVGVVEEPGMSVAAATARIQDNVREMKPVGWVNATVVRRLEGNRHPFPRRPWESEADPAAWVASAQQATAKVLAGADRPLAEDEKGRAAGSLDPYHITYEETGLLPWLTGDEMPGPVVASLRAQLAAVRIRLGRTDEMGWPYLDVYSRTQNMQMGPAVLAVVDSGTDPALRQFYRDQLSSPVLSAVMLRAFRPYEGRVQDQPAFSDTIYQAVVDFFIRAAELETNEALGYCPVAYGRYLDAVDVTADLYHRGQARDPDPPGRFARANFFRAQSHLHRWLMWGPAPFIALLAPPHDGSVVPGSSEAWHFADDLAGRWKNWPDQSWLFLASVLSERARGYAPAPRPGKVGPVTVQPLPEGNGISWPPLMGVAGYRLYRLRPGSPPQWLNSPYLGAAPLPAGTTEWRDAGGAAGDRYEVHAVDEAGREGSW